MLSVLRFTTSDYPFGIFKLFFIFDRSVICKIVNISTNRTTSLTVYLVLIGGLVVDYSGEYMIPDVTPYEILLDVNVRIAK